MKDHSEAMVRRMRHGGCPEPLTERFVQQYRQLVEGFSGKLCWDEIEPPAAEDIVDAEAVCDARHRARGERLLDRLVIIKLNGGLGTTMKLSGPKSLIAVRGGQSFLQLAVQQKQRLRERYAVQTPLLLMNSFRTRDASLAALRDVDLQQPDDLPLDFLQHRVPRIDRDSGLPLDLPDEQQCWAPPGHGDVYLALLLSGLLEQLVSAGYRWAFVSNIDNLAATVDPALLGYLDSAGVDFAMEVTDKTAADIKGGTLVRHRGQLSLLERAQVEPEHLSDFEDTSQLSVFNTNSLWWRTDSMLAALRDDPVGGLQLPLIVNPKKVVDRDVVQLETAMGAAIGQFERAIGLRVARDRFAPVKGTVDLVAVRSDAYVVDDDGGLRPHPDRRGQPPPRLLLDPRHYGGASQIEQLCPHPLGLRRCSSLTVEGPIRFGQGVTFTGDVVLRNTLPADTVAVIDDDASYADGTFVVTKRPAPSDLDQST